MAKGISLHIGLNRVDPKHYQGWDGALAACEYDAQDMLAIARKQRFKSSRLLLTEAATSAGVLNAIGEAAQQLVAGDLFWITYSGHGGQVRDVNGDEPDAMDETWVLYDRMVIDDELYALWGRFKAGVRILALSDSCHSGTVLRAVPAFMEGGPPIRAMPATTVKAVYRANKRAYDAIQKHVKSGPEVKVQASVLLISGCQDNQYSADGDRNGLFTQTLRRVWAGGKFSGNYRTFRYQIARRMPATQSPNYFFAGKPNPAFEAQKPFTV